VGRLNHAGEARVMKLISLPIAAVAAFICSDPALQNNVKIDQVRYVYLEPANAEHRWIYERLRELRVLENISEFLSPLRLPRTLTLNVEGCDGRINAYYWNDSIQVCYEYFDFLLKVAPEASTPEGISRHDALAGMTSDVFLHETGHAVFDMLEIPFLGREEDAADQFSAYVLLQMAMDDARRLILGATYLASKEAQEEMARPLQPSEFADVHELPAQRYFNVLCMAYGKDAKVFADAVERQRLPEKRARNCRYEYRRFEYAFWTLIGPYIDRARVEQVKAKRLLRFESEK
jgi:hypothetical protein